MTKNEIKLLAPGSDDAIKLGCTCPIMDNNRGRGMYVDTDGTPIFVFNLDCPIHGNSPMLKPDKNRELKEIHE